ncbi:MAG: hypothetical protein R3A51_22915 [Nannocystaceae bacterium]|nr:hypothetical protein [Myxococcales bacterium]
MSRAGNPAADVAACHVAINSRQIRFPAASFLRRLVYWWWIVPRVQWDLADLDYQLYTFEIFHTDWRAKLAHYVTIPAITFFSMAFLAQFHVGAPLLNGALAYAAALALLHLGWCRRLGKLTLWVVTVGALLLLWLLATAWHDWAAIDGPWYRSTRLYANPLLWVYLFSLAETLSHAFEPVPPYASGSDRFVSGGEFMRAGGLYRLAGVVGAPTTYTIVSFASNLHLFPTLMQRLLASTGHDRAYVRSVERLAARQWESGQPVIHRVPEAELR